MDLHVTNGKKKMEFFDRVKNLGSTPTDGSSRNSRHIMPWSSPARTPVSALFNTRQSVDPPRRPEMSSIAAPTWMRSTSAPVLSGGEDCKASVVEHPARLLIPASKRSVSEDPEAKPVPMISINPVRREKRSPDLHPAAHLLSNWLQECEDLHGDACRPANCAPNYEAPSFLIDVHKGRIIPTKGKNHDYVALSYHRLEKNRSPDLSKEELSDLLNCTSFLRDSRLPLIVHQTMDLVRAFGGRYLWIDFLCLAHGEMIVKEEMKRMDQIYAGAHFTVIAACKDGLHEVHEQKSPLQNPFTTAADAMNYHYTTLLGSKWATRGWTFQERMFSTRSIVFIPRSYVSSNVSQQVQPRDGAPYYYFFWECERAMWDDGNLSTSSAPNVGNAMLLHNDPRFLKPNEFTEQRLHFARYFQTIYHYNHRDFENPQDVLPAISGCLRRTSEEFDVSFRTGFVYGLPQQKFHESLLWQPLGRSIRRECNCEKHYQSEHQIMPSWAWCGWKCELDLQSMPLDQRETTSSDSERMDAWEVEPTVRWELLWKKENGGFEKPMGFRSSHSRLVEQLQWPLLTCEAHTAVLIIRFKQIEHHEGPRRVLRNKLPSNPSPPTRQVATLERSDGTWAGVLGLTEPVNPSHYDGQEVQLMEISKGSMGYETFRDLYEEKIGREVPDEGKAESKYEFFNVLWIEEKNGRCSRKALGRVDAEVWTDLCKGTKQSRVILE